MASVVQCASCYAQNSIQPLELYRRESRQADCMSLFMYRVPHYVPRPRLVCNAPKMTLRQVCRLLKMMKQVRKREAATSNSRKQGSMIPTPTCPVKSERCFPSCCRRRRTASMKRFV